MTREEAINMVQGARQYLTAGNPMWNAKEIDEAMSMAINALAVCQQYKWERDIAIEQLEEYGIGFAEKKRDMVEVVRCKECKNRARYAVDIARYNGGMWQYDGFTFPDCEVLAWMPLPEPYKGGDTE